MLYALPVRVLYRRISGLKEVSEYYEAVPEHICEYCAELKEIEKIEVIHFVTRYILRKN